MEKKKAPTKPIRSGASMVDGGKKSFPTKDSTKAFSGRRRIEIAPGKPQGKDLPWTNRP